MAFFGPASGIVLRTANAQVKLDLSSLPNAPRRCVSPSLIWVASTLTDQRISFGYHLVRFGRDGYMDTPFYGGQETLNGSTIGGST